MPFQHSPSSLFDIKIRIAGQRIQFSAPYQNRAEATARIITWLEQYLGDSTAPLVIIIKRAKLLH